MHAAHARLSGLLLLAALALSTLLTGCGPIRLRRAPAPAPPEAERPAPRPGAAQHLRPAPESVLTDSIDVGGEKVRVACPADSAERARALAWGPPPRFPSQVDHPAAERSPAPAAAPASAPRATTLRFVVDASGAPEPGTITLIRSAGTPEAARACAAVLRSRYEPARVSGRAVRQWVERTYVF